MRKILLSAIASIGLLSFTFNVLPIGAPMPKGDVKMKDITGKEVTLNDARNTNGILVMFSCNTCPFVIKNQQRTKDIASYLLSKNIGVALVNSNEAQRDNEDSFEAMKQYAKQQGYQWYYAVDKNSELADAFGATRTPECFLFNKEGKLVYHGAIDDNPGNEAEVNRKHLKEAIDEMLAGKEVSVTTSRSVGCTIKRKA
ncbi:thioredoxin family protein [Chitinophagaceae bacterium LB-8]|uniref:Thioredoxin family protein n=1 Tax=Paraflavisolibacter caeni TaxID=2982496 RepID=A0A9X2XTS7_9BACT|nr:thioredoxin family protein [Paraflavisolibacter caeni]MCU7549094.1 thioredoxin family protein [Paraflavisolibacter caeni]